MVRLKGADHKDWMAYHHALRRAHMSRDPSMLSLVEVVSNIVGIWALIVSYLKKTELKSDGDNLVVEYTSWVCFRMLFRK